MFQFLTLGYWVVFISISLYLLWVYLRFDNKPKP